MAFQSLNILPPKSTILVQGTADTFLALFRYFSVGLCSNPDLKDKM